MRRVLPLAPVALVAAFALGQVLGGSGAAWSAAIAVVIVTANFVANALSVAWAAHISPMILYARGDGRVRRATRRVHDRARAPEHPCLVLTRRLRLDPGARHDRVAGRGGTNAFGPAPGRHVVLPGDGSLNVAFLGATFEAPSTKDFVYGCWGGGVNVFGFELCLNFVTFLVILTFGIMFLLFYLAFRAPTVVPGKLQTMMELGVSFVREQIVDPRARSERRPVPPAPRILLLLHPDREPLRGRSRGSASPRTAESRSHSRWRSSPGSPTTGSASRSTASSAT